MNVTLESVAERNPAMIFTDLDDTVVMMDADKGMYYELDPIATRVWTLLETARSVAEVCDVLAGEYDVSSEVCRRDVLALLRQAQELGIVEVRAPAHDEVRGGPDSLARR